MRTTAADLEAAAADALRHALAEVDLPASDSTAADLVIHTLAGPVGIEIKAVAVADAARVRAMLRPALRAPGVPVVVADKVTEEARSLLRDAGWGYLDRRGALWLQAPGVFISHTDLDPLPRAGATAKDEPISGRVALGVAVHMLIDPHEPIVQRDVARRLGCSPSNVNAAVARLRDHSLIENDGTPLVPELFDVTADAWNPSRFPLPVAVPELGWLLSGDLAARQLGAPLVANADGPMVLYGRSSLTEHDLPGPVDTPAVNVASPEPFPLPLSGRTAAGRPIVHPVVIALDLAQDRSRGREILDGWTPPEEFTRVW